MTNGREPTRVVIASDNFLTREGLGCLLKGIAGIEVVGKVESHAQTLDAANELTPQVVIIGMRTPRTSAEAAIEAARRLRRDHPAVGVVVIAESGDGYALELLRGGAAGVAYLLEDRVGDLETLIDAIYEVRAGETLLDPSIVNALVRRRISPTLESLSLRELSVLEQMARGFNNREIATLLSISVKAVESNVTSIFRKLAIAGSKRLDRRVAAVLTYLDAYGELSSASFQLSGDPMVKDES